MSAVMIGIIPAVAVISPVRIVITAVVAVRAVTPVGIVPAVAPVRVIPAAAVPRTVPVIVEAYAPVVPGIVPAAHVPAVPVPVIPVPAVIERAAGPEGTHVTTVHPRAVDPGIIHVNYRIVLRPVGEQAVSQVEGIKLFPGDPFGSESLEIFLCKRLIGRCFQASGIDSVLKPLLRIPG
jgi:hypothetical protein